MRGTQQPPPWQFTWLARLALLSLITPFIRLEVDPGCSHPQRANVPDVWIVGAYIFGKWILFPGILIAWIAQTFGILLFHTLVRLATRFRNDPDPRLTFLVPAGLLLACFPFWMHAYVIGVKNNSDGVCFITHYSLGWVLYAAMVYLIARLLSRSIKAYWRSALGAHESSRQ